MQGHACCTPRGDANAAAPVHGHAAAAPVPRDWIALSGGRFRMGSDDAVGYAADGEGPSRVVELSPYRIAATTVTNAEFAAFVRATRYVTQAEQAGSSFVFALQLDAVQRAAARQAPRGLPWWRVVDDACWQRPEGPGSSIDARLDHPVVHVSWHDAMAYCAWAGVRLPTEAQWEYAARGGLEQARYPWGDDFECEGEGRCNTWRGRFPDAPAAPPGTQAARSLPPNGHGLYHAAGNVWEWCADGFSPTYHLDAAPVDPLQARDTGQRSLRGGSFLCHASYCHRYRVAARHANTPSSTASHCGFRVVA
jgi:formylglycine-generating enzyme